MSEQYQNMHDGEICDCGSYEKPVPNESQLLPKNIRQIGRPGEWHTVYIEDYAYTYLHMFLKEKYKGDTLRTAVLAGTVHQQDDRTFVFVCGAISCDFSVLHMGSQEQIQTIINEHFTDLLPVGWYIGCGGQDSHVQSVVKHYYAQMDEVMPGYLFYEDDFTGNMDLFCWKQNGLHLMEGYYIYYEKNPQMQEFLISEKRELRGTTENGGSKFSNGEIPFAQSDGENKTILEQNVKRHAKEELARFTDQHKRPSGKKTQRIVYAACAAALIVAAATGVSQIGNYQSLKNFQETVSRMVGSEKGKMATDVSETSNGDSLVENSESGQQKDVTENDENSSITAAASTVSDGVQDQNESNGPVDEASGMNTDTNQTSEGVVDSQSGQTLDATTNDTTQEIFTGEDGTKYYIVQKGDSLMSISRKLYQRTDCVDEIRTLNNMQDTDMIYEGQKLLVP